MREHLKDFNAKMRMLLSSYLKKSKEEIEEMIRQTPQRAVDDWHSMGIDKFYRDTDVYLYGLIEYSTWNRLENILLPLTKQHGQKILDYGAGIGAVSIPLTQNNDVYYYDLPSKTQDFARYMVNKLDVKLTFLEKDDIWTREYDVIICVDVLEHLKKPMELVEKITKHLKKGQYFLTSGLDFSIGDHTPMHLPENAAYRGVYGKHMDENYHLAYYIKGYSETIFLFIKR